MLELIIILILFNTTIIHCSHKWKLLEKYSAYRLKWMPDPDCYLCLSFWITVIQCIILAFINPSIGLLIVPFCVASGTNWLVNQAILKDYMS